MGAWPEITWAPIGEHEWPGELRKERRRPQFKTDFDKSVRKLSAELGRIDAEAVLLKTAHFKKHFTREGRPYADQIPRHPGVLLAFTKAVKDKLGQRRVPLVFPADVYDDWKANVHALYLGLEALRAVDRHGISGGSQQYIGWKMLPPGPDHPAVITIDEGARLLAGFYDGAIGTEAARAARVLSDADYYKAAYRAAAAALHPDKQNHNPEAWAKLQAAQTLLDHHHGL